MKYAWKGLKNNTFAEGEIEADSKEVASSKVDEACKKMLCNQIMESFKFTLEEV